MKQKGNGGVRAGLIITAIGLVSMLLPFLVGADMMAWGFGTMALGFFVLTAGVTTFLLYQRRRKVLQRMDESREVLARWTYSREEWQKWQREEMNDSKSVTIFGLVLGGIFLVIGIVFFASDPDEMGVMLAMMAGFAILIAFIAWLSTALRRRAVRKDPGEAVIARGGVWFMGFLTDWNGVTSWFDAAKVEKKGKRAFLVIEYRYLSGRYARIHSGSVRIPVPDGHEEEAKEVAGRLNGQPY